MTRLQRWIVGAVALVALIAVAGPIGTHLMSSVGGRSKAVPSTTIAVVTRSVITTGEIRAGEPLTFSITNREGGTVTYRWEASVNGASMHSGSLNLTDGSTATETISTKGATPGERIAITLRDQSPHLSIKVGPAS